MRQINNFFYDELQDKWHEASDHPIALLRAENSLRNPWIASSIPPASKVLDIGCGAGFLTHHLGEKGHTVFGVDLSLSSLEMAKKRDPSGTYLQANAMELPFDAESFDVVSAMDLLEHVEDPLAVIREAGRVLRPGGLFFFHTFNRTWLSYILVIKGVEWVVKNTPKNMHVYSLFITPQEISKMCQKAGLSTVEIKGVRPKVKLAFWKMVFTRTVPDDFEFEFTPSLRTGYSGYSRKNTS